MYGFTSKLFDYHVSYFNKIINKMKNKFSEQGTSREILR